MAGFFEQIYPHLPVWTQNLGISIFGLAWRRERLGGDFSRHLTGFVEREGWSPDQMRHYLNERLREVLVHAFEQVPYYRRVWKDAGIDREDLARMTLDSLRRIPITKKESLRNDPDDFVAENVSQRRKLHRYASSGSTGTPITAICTADGHRRFIAAREARSWRWANTSIFRSRSMIGGRVVVPKALNRPPFHRYNWPEKQVYFSAFHISPRNVSDYVEAFNRLRPRLLTGYAYSHYILARMMEEQGLTLDYEPDALVLTSEKLTNEMKRRIKKSFRTRAYEEYGAVENCGLATECEEGSLHVSPDFGILELIGEDGDPVPPGREGRIICTALQNEAQPLIRYEVGDTAIWASEPCACGRDHLPVLKDIVGRIEDVIISPDGREMVRFHGIFVGLENVLEGQVIQESLQRITVKVVAECGFGAREENIIRERFHTRLGPVEVNIQRVSEIPRTDRGKFRAVVSRLTEADRMAAQKNTMQLTGV